MNLNVKQIYIDGAYHLFL